MGVRLPTGVGVVLHRIEVAKVVEALGRLELLLLLVAEELRQLSVERPELHYLGQPPADVGGVLGGVGRPLPAVGRVVGPEEGRELPAGIGPPLAQVASLSEGLLHLAVRRLPQVQGGALRLDESESKTFEDE